MDTKFVYATNSITPRQHPINLIKKKKKLDACVDVGNGNVIEDKELVTTPPTVHHCQWIGDLSSSL